MSAEQWRNDTWRRQFCIQRNTNLTTKFYFETSNTAPEEITCLEFGPTLSEHQPLGSGFPPILKFAIQARSPVFRIWITASNRSESSLL